MIVEAAIRNDEKWSPINLRSPTKGFFMWGLIWILLNQMCTSLLTFSHEGQWNSYTKVINIVYASHSYKLADSLFVRTFKISSNCGESKILCVFWFQYCFCLRIQFCMYNSTSNLLQRKYSKYRFTAFPSILDFNLVSQMSNFKNVTKLIQ